eukprot:GHUV01024014.1.p1 GENE.GHUV01024014.1~~GHUV01024014.1.p1  ORF type:complete len:263 (+),score=109.61 GHUV01024014.1:870-1658(+)
MLVQLQQLGQHQRAFGVRHQPLLSVVTMGSLYECLRAERLIDKVVWCLLCCKHTLGWFLASWLALQVEYVDGFWMRQPLTLASIQQCSMLLTGMEQMLYEQSDDFLEASYQAVKQRQQLTQTKSTLRRATKCLALLQELLTAVQENNTEAVISVQREARKNYMLANADQSQQPEVQQTRKQQQEPAQKPGSKAKRDRAPQQQAAEASAVRQKQREALERLQQLQAAGAGVSTAHVAAGPKLVRPLGSHIFGGPSQPPPQQQQ